MSTLMKWLAPGVFSLAFLLFRSRLLKTSHRKHQWIMRIFRFAADNGSRQALSVYGHLLHFRGEGQDNRIQGGIYLQRAADKGEVKAQYQIARIYESGFEHYFPSSDEKALNYYLQAASQGHTLAISRLVKIYQYGELGQVANLAETERWQALQPTLPLAE